MKIAIFVHCFFPDHFYGTETYTLNIAKQMQAMGHVPVVVTAKFQGEPRNIGLVTEYSFEGIPVYCIDKNHIPHRRFRETFYQEEMRKPLKELLAKISPDIVHVTHLINHTAVLLDVTVELGIPVVATFTDFFGFCFNCKLEAADGSLCQGPDPFRANCVACLLKAKAQNPGAPALDRLMGTERLVKMVPLMARKLDRTPLFREASFARDIRDVVNRFEILHRSYSCYKAAIAPTNFLRSAYAKNGMKIPIHLRHFGVDLPRTPKSRVKSNTPIRIGYIGQIAPHKGTGILIDAFNRLQRGVAELHIYGPENQDPHYMASLKTKAQSSSVFFHGIFPKDQMSRVLGELDFIVIPSVWYENSPLVLLNALASHTPVIVSDVEGLTEFVAEQKNGFIFKRGSVADLERVLSIIAADSARSREMSLTTEYPKTTKMMAEEVLAIYRQVLHLN